MNSPIHLLIWLISIAVYFIPAIIALARPAPHRGRVAVVNLFAFLVVPWIWALVMACRTTDRQSARQDHHILPET
jgi:hypothetical protein